MMTWEEEERAQNEKEGRPGLSLKKFPTCEDDLAKGMRSPD